MPCRLVNAGGGAHDLFLIFCHTAAATLAIRFSSALTDSLLRMPEEKVRGPHLVRRMLGHGIVFNMLLLYSKWDFFSKMGWLLPVFLVAAALPLGLSPATTPSHEMGRPALVWAGIFSAWLVLHLPTFLLEWSDWPIFLPLTHGSSLLAMLVANCRFMLIIYPAARKQQCSRLIQHHTVSSLSPQPSPPAGAETALSPQPSPPADDETADKRPALWQQLGRLAAWICKLTGSDTPGHFFWDYCLPFYSHLAHYGIMAFLAHEPQWPSALWDLYNRACTSVCVWSLLTYFISTQLMMLVKAKGTMAELRKDHPHTVKCLVFPLCWPKNAEKFWTDGKAD